MSRSVCLAIIAVTSLLCGEVRADKRAARKVFQRAEVRFKKRQYRSALVLYKRAYELAPLPGFHFNIAQCHRLLGEHEDAVRHFELYLSESKNPRNRKAARQLLRLSRRKLRGQRRRHSSPPARGDPSAQASDGEPVPGVTNKIEKQQDQGASEPALPTLTPDPGNTERTTVTRHARDDDTPESERPLSSFYFWTGVGISASFLLTGAITGVLALSRSSEFRDPATAYEDLQSLKDSGETFRTISSVTFAIGSALAVGTAVLYFYTDFKPRRTKVSLMPYENGAAVVFVGRY